MPRLLSALVTLVIAAAAVADTEVRTLDGKNLRGKITELSPTEVTIVEESGPAKVPLKQLLSINFTPPRTPLGKYTEVRLVDDTNLFCSKVQFKEKSVALTLTSGAAVELPFDFVKHVVQDAQDAPLRQKFVELTKAKIKRDRIVALRSGELNAVEGTFGKIDPAAQTIEFRREGVPPLNLPLDRLHGMIFYRLDTALESPVCMVYDSQGNMLAASGVALKDGKYQVTTTFGAKLAFDADVLAKLDFNMGKLTYLSDLEPTKVTEKSTAGLIVRYRKDCNLDGEPIILDKEYTRGLSLHAHTELDYNLAGKYKAFKALVGIDSRIDSAGGQPVLTILCDGDKRFSETIVPNAWRPISIDVRDVTTLRIIVSSSNLLDLHDHLSLGDARVSQ